MNNQKTTYEGIMEGLLDLPYLNDTPVLFRRAITEKVESWIMHELDGKAFSRLELFLLGKRIRWVECELFQKLVDKRVEGMRRLGQL